ncbi:MAG: hypothetical protein IJW48_03100 [Clostridia bacterium]|nr:hypothetical protein [Clostridia bacterium]
MKKIVSMLLAIVMLVGCLSVLGSCGAPKDDGAEFNIYLGNEVYDFDPSDYYADSTAEQVMSLLYEPLFSVNKKGKLVKAAASDYDIDEEKRTVVVTLRETYWSDGVRVKANDFVYAWCERILNPNSPNPAAALLYDIENARKVKSGEGTISDIGVKATGIYELTITYREGADVDRLLRNLASVATSPLRQDVVDTAPTYFSKMINTMVFSGPFQVRTYDYATKEFSLERNLGYHQSPSTKNYTKNVTPGTMYSFFTASGSEMTVSYSDIENKTRFFMCEAPLADRAAKEDKATVVDTTSAYTYVFNLDKPLFKIPQVRQALSMAIDREAIANALVFAKAADGILPDAAGGSSETLITTSAKLDEARALLATVDLSGVSPYFTIKHADTEEERYVAEAVAAAWNSLGYFTVTTVAVSEVKNSVGGSTFYDSGIQTLVKEASYGKRNFDVLAVDWQYYCDDAFVGLSAFTSDTNGCGVDFSKNANRTNIAGYANEAYDTLIDSAFTKSGEERAALLRDAERLLVTDAAVCPIVFNSNFAFVSSELRKVETDGFGHFVLTKAKLKNYEDYLED